MAENDEYVRPPLVADALSAWLKVSIAVIMFAAGVTGGNLRPEESGEFSIPSFFVWSLLAGLAYVPVILVFAAVRRVLVRLEAGAATVGADASARVD